jgi:AraC-like DNA-binding protein
MHMKSVIPFWPVPLGNAPVLRHMATPVHGAIRVESWKNLGFWCLHSYRYYADLRIDQSWFEIRPGLVSIFPPSCEQEFRYRGPSRHTYAHFDLPRQRDGDAVLLPALIDLGDRFEAFDAKFREAAAWLPSQPSRSQARIWDLLWQLTSFSQEQGVRSSGHLLVDRGVEWIERRLSEPLKLSQVADELDISPTHLVRLFRKHLALTPLAYVQKRRAEQAEHLLIHTTLPMKSIARQIGLVDLQQFNKFLRKMRGRSPRAIRSAL